MEALIGKLQTLTNSVNKVEIALEEMWRCIDEIGDDEEYSKLMEQLEQHEEGPNSDGEIRGFRTLDGGIRDSPRTDSRKWNGCCLL